MDEVGERLDLDDQPAFNNTGTVSVQAGTLDLQGAVTGTGSETTSGASILEFASTVASSQTVGFAGTGGTIDLNDPSGFLAGISNFATTTDAVSLLGSWALSGFSENSGQTLGTLTLTNGSTDISLDFNGNYGASNFKINQTGGRTIIAHA